MKYLSILIIGLLMTLSGVMNAQTGYSVADAIPVDFVSSNTVTFNNVNTQNSTGTSDGTLGGCSTNQFPTLVYKVTLTQEGALFVESDNAIYHYATNPVILLGYDGAANATSNADLTFRNAGGNICNVRDTMFWGQGYNKWSSVPHWKDPATFNPGTNPINSYSIPAGTYYIHFSNYNSVTPSYAGPSNLTFEFIPYCDGGSYPDIAAEGSSTNIVDGDDTPSATDDTDYGIIVSGSSAISKTFTIKNTDPTTALNISNVAITGTNAANFSITTSPASVVAVNSSTTMTVEFTPNTIGENTATIEITSNDCDEKIFNFDIKGFVTAITPSATRGNMLDLNGTSDYVNINAVAGKMDGENDFTLEAWFNADLTQSGNDRIISINTSSGGNVYLLYLDDGVLTTYDGNNSDPFGNDLRGTGWHHIAIANNRSKDYIYLDGEFIGNLNWNSFPDDFSAADQWSIGQEFDGGSTGDFFKGQMDEVRIWKDMRTEAEIRENMHLTFSETDIAASPNLVAYYQFDNDDAAGTVDGVKDILGNHGTSVGGTYAASEVAVGAGISVSKTIDVATIYTFTGTDVEIIFSSSTTPPNGDVVVTKITSETVKNPSANEMTNTTDSYWIIRNYGSSPILANLRFVFEQGFLDDDIKANHTIHKRGSNEFEVVDWMDLSPTFLIEDTELIGLTVTSFSQFYLSSNTSDFQPAVLPIELSYFKGQLTEEKTTELIWQTTTEENNQGFEIQRSTNGKEWENIGYKSGNGTSVQIQNYEFIDFAPLAGMNYYRLKQMDFDGQFDYSDIISIENKRVDKPVKVYPTVVKDQLTIENGEGNAAIFNLLGQPVKQFAVNSQQVTISMSDLLKGQYLIRIMKNDGTIVTKRFLK
ncbi:MAG: LamG-like jellyroll fold domain-containing protein [Saprospiraceae bacterium]